MMEEKRENPRLKESLSPYLRQHRFDPIEWYPWSREALQRAQKEQKPIFLTIGYSTCHWCHVMQEKTFSSPRLASLLNAYFIPVILDREENPELDLLYIEAAQSLIAGSAGWPLNILLTPDLKPFFASTYMPLEHALEVIRRMKELWNGEARRALIEQSERLAESMKKKAIQKGEELPFEERVLDVAETLFRVADPIYGGMKGAPKFPLGYQMIFLLRYSLRYQDNRGIFLAEKTLKQAYQGGIHDLIGGGFARYSIDDQWHIPHFEKMVSDNVFLALAYLEAFRVTSKEFYREVCEEILQWVFREMHDNETGAFYSSEDADSEGKEGYFYTWTRDEILSILGPEKGQLFCDIFNVAKEGIFDGRSVLYREESIGELAEIVNMSEEELDSILAESKMKLFYGREKREKPFVDKKVLSTTNGLMIRLLAEAGLFFDEDLYIQEAEKTAQLIKKILFKDGLLYRCKGENGFHGALEDYAYLISGVLSLFEANGKEEYLLFAIELAGIVKKEFKAKEGGYFQNDGLRQDLFLRKCHFFDGSEPSGNGVHSENLLRLYQITGKQDYLKEAEDIFKALRGCVDKNPISYCYHILSLLRYFDTKKKTLVLCLDEKKESKRDIASILTHKVIPHYSLIWRHPEEKNENSILYQLEELPQENPPTLHICSENMCEGIKKGKQEIKVFLQQW